MRIWRKCVLAVVLLSHLWLCFQWHDKSSSVEEAAAQLLLREHDKPASLAWDPTTLSQFRSEGSENRRGGVLVFYHNPKTGGTTIRNNMLATKNVSVVRAYRPKDATTVDRNIQLAIDNSTSSEWLVLEIHGNVPGIAHWQPYLHEWRRRTGEADVPFFAMTLLREPVDFSVSYFFHFHRIDCHFSWCERDLYSLSENNLLRSLRRNHQCQLFWHGQRGNKRRKPPPPDVSLSDCRQVQTHLQQDWDWVGTTEQMQTVTLPLLTHLVLQNATMGRYMPAFNRRRYGGTASRSATILSTEDLDAGTAQVIREHSQYDMELYQTVQDNERRIARKLVALQIG